MAEDPRREIMGAAARLLRATGERWAELVARLDVGDEQLEAAWAEDAEVLCAALRTLGEEPRPRRSPGRMLVSNDAVRRYGARSAGDLQSPATRRRWPELPSASTDTASSAIRSRIATHGPRGRPERITPCAVSRSAKAALHSARVFMPPVRVVFPPFWR